MPETKPEFRMPTVEEIDGEVAKQKKVLADLRAMQRAVYKVYGKELPKKPKKKAAAAA